jgi:hypothetical protein
MPACSVCGETNPDGTRVCAVCGSALPEVLPTARVVPPPSTVRQFATVPTSLPVGGRFCPGCGTVYDAEYKDAFCICGTELLTELPFGVAAAPAAAPTATVPLPDVPLPDVPLPDVPLPDVPLRPPPERPPAGTTCLVLYGPDREPIHYFPLTKDVTVIGRLDAAGGNFPDIDLDEWLDAPTARRISRQHALVLRSRATGGYSLRPLSGNTGTQVETEMVLPMHDYPLAPGRRLILGGVARLKFEIT